VPTDHVIGLDLGQAQDYTALAVLERSAAPGEPPAYAVRHLRRFPLGTPYTAVVPAVAALAVEHPLSGCPVVADQTGVGRAVVDALRAAEPRPRVVAVTITGGHKATCEKDGCDEHHAVPKKELVGVLQLLLQGRRLKVAASLPEAAVLTRELQAFRSKVSVATGHESFEAWRERDHDDLVLAVALACWWAEGHPQPGPVWVPPKSEFLQWLDRLFPGV
jgi:hypothetical protein